MAGCGRSGSGNDSQNSIEDAFESLFGRDSDAADSDSSSGLHSEQGAEDAGSGSSVPELTQEQKALYLSEDGYVDPAAYGAAGDGVTDDTEALQMAIDSGYNVRLQDTTYFISAEQHIDIRTKTDFHMEGGTIHKEASPSNYQLFVLTDCSSCSFSNMYIYSEFAYEDILVPKDHMRPSATKSSNVLAFSGTGNSGIQFLNNSFAYLSADYWFNSREDAFWTDITVDGWDSASTLMPMYTQCVTGLTVRNANVSLHQGGGDGDHCMYVCYMTTDVVIEDSVFTGNNTGSLQGAVVVLTFHGGDERRDTQPKNIQISRCTIYAGSGRALYCEEGTDITVSDSRLLRGMPAPQESTITNQETPGTLESSENRENPDTDDPSRIQENPDTYDSSAIQENPAMHDSSAIQENPAMDDSSRIQEISSNSYVLSGEGFEKPFVFGYGSYSFTGCEIEAVETAFEGMDTLVLNNTTVSGGTTEALITGVRLLEAEGADFTTGGGTVLYMNQSSHPDHSYTRCSFTKTSNAVPYMFSDRSSDGRILLKECRIDAGNQWFAYNGSRSDISSFTLENTQLINSAGMDMNKGE